MMILNAINDEAGAIDTATAYLGAGLVVALPTETVYGLAADATNGAAVANIFATKGRPKFNPLICHVADLAMAERYGTFNETARKLAQAFWPGPLTLVVRMRRAGGLHDLVSAGLDTVALRCPRGIVAKISQNLACPLAAPSANTSGRISPTTAQHVADDLGDKVELIIDGGPCKVGLESTILKVVEDMPDLLRAGGISVEVIEAELNHPIRRIDATVEIEAPGMMSSHYAPRAGLRINALDIGDGETFLAFGKPPPGILESTLNLSPCGDMVEAASNLYSYLKQLDEGGATTIAVQPIPDHGLGEAINDRLQRAAAPRENDHG